MDDSDIQSDNSRLGSSFSQGFFVGSPKDSFNVAKWLGDSKKLFGNIIKNKPQDNQNQVEDFNTVFYPRRPRTQSVSSDISVDDQPTGERRSSFSERYFAMQMQQPKSAEKFNNFRTAITSYYD